MAETLKNRYGPEVPARIAEMILRIHGAFPKRAFLCDALDGYAALELMARGRHIARALNAAQLITPQAFGRPCAAATTKPSRGSGPRSALSPGSAPAAPRTGPRRGN